MDEEEQVGADGENFTLQILHASDQEAGTAAFKDAIGFSAVLNHLESNYTNSLKITSGDLYIAGPFFNASGAIYDALPEDPLVEPEPAGQPGIADILIQSLYGWNAATVGNHEFDAGPATFFNLVAPNADIINGGNGGVGLGPNGYLGTPYPYLASNLDYTNAGVPDGIEILEGGLSPRANSLAPSTVVDVNGEPIGIIGTVTPYLESIANVGDVEVTTDDENGLPITATTEASVQAASIIANITPEVAALTEAGITKIILATHLQEAEIEQELAQQLVDQGVGVDVLIGGGSHRVMSSSTEIPPLREDETQQNDGSLLEPYPQVFTSSTAGGDGSNANLLYVNSGANYRYLAELVVSFDAEGQVILDEVEGAVYGTDLLGVQTLYGEEVQTFDDVRALADPRVVAIVDGVAESVNAQDGTIFGQSSVFLDGVRTEVRTEETNLGNLSADAQRAYATAYLEANPDLLPGFTGIDLSFKNGGGIRDSIGTIRVEGGGSEEVRGPTEPNTSAGKEAGDISQLDIANSLRFDNELVVGTVTAENLLAIAEHGVSGVESISGRFAQVSGFSYSYDPEAAAGARIQTLAVNNDDGTVREIVYQDGAFQVDPATVYSVVTLSFLADGGDSYPVVIEDPISLADPGLTEPATLGLADLVAGGEQDALAEYLAAFFSDAQVPPQAPFSTEDTPVSDDQRIQNLAFREDTISLGIEGSAAPDANLAALLVETS